MSEAQLAEIPNKTYFTIGEVGKLCGVQETVLRYWQERFRQLNPVRRRGRRYYQRKDIELIRRIRDLLYVKGYTINGAKKALIESEPMAAIVEPVAQASVSAPTTAQVIPTVTQEIPVHQPIQAQRMPSVDAKKALLLELESLLADIK